MAAWITARCPLPLMWERVSLASIRPAPAEDLSGCLRRAPACGTMRLSHHALPVLIHWTRQMLWRLLAAVSVLLGVIGAFLPVLPTVPFLLLAAWAAGRGWPELEARLLAHPKYGPHIIHWREHGAVPRRAKWLASVMMLFSATTLWFSPVPTWLRGSVWLILIVVAGWLWTRPEPASDD